MEPTPDAEADAPADYRQAATELETILSRLESSAVDVDTLATEVKRAVDLIAFCRRRLTAVETELDEALLGLARSNETISTPDGDDS